MKRVALLTLSLQVAPVLLGYLFGNWVGYPGRPPTVYSWMALVALLLQAAGLLCPVPIRAAGKRGWARWVVPCYAIAVVLGEPFMWLRDASDLAIAAALLLPLLLVVWPLVRSRAWVQAAGVALLVFTSVAMMTSNASIRDAGSGFLAYWVS
jgi:hypothetical protein